MINFEWEFNATTKGGVDAYEEGYGFSDGECHRTLEVANMWEDKTEKELPAFHFDVGLEYLGKHEPGYSIPYTPMFIQNLKYELEVYFAPKGYDEVDKLLVEVRRDG